MKCFLRKLEERQHFVDDDSLYSLQDLLDVESGSLGAWLGQILEQWQDHILSCILCRAKVYTGVVAGSYTILYTLQS